MYVNSWNLSFQLNLSHKCFIVIYFNIDYLNLVDYLSLIDYLNPIDNLSNIYWYY